MAANYWNSTQRRFWYFTKEKLADIREELEDQDGNIVQQCPLPDRRLISIHLKEQLIRLSRRLTTRQQALATCLVYIHRYLLSTSLYCVNPYLLLSTSFYLASKTEESPHHIRLVLSEARQLWPDFVTGDVSRIGEMEFSLISEMRSQLIVWHPYRTLMDLKENANLGLTVDEVGLAWTIINDSYLTDLPLTCPPHVISLMAIFLAVVFQPTKSNLALQRPQPPLAANSVGGAISNIGSAISNNPNGFQSIGGRPGLANSLSNAINGGMMPNTIISSSSQPTSAPNMAPLSASGGAAPGTTKGKPYMAIDFASDKIRNMVQFLAESEVNIEQMIEATQEIISLYEVWEQYNEKSVKDALTKYVRARGLDK